MKIGGVGGKKVGGTTRTKKGSSSSSKRVEKIAAEDGIASMGPGSNEDQFEVSEHVQTLEFIRDMVNDSADIRTGEVDRIMNDLKSGKFKVDLAKVAEGFLREAIVNEMSKRMRRKRDS